MNPTPTKPQRWRPNIVFVILVGLLFSLSAIAQPAFIKDGLVAYYPFNGNANDESGNGKHGTLYGANKPQLSIDRLGNQQSAYNFSGNGSISIPDRVINTVAYTISTWFKRTDTNGNKIIIFFGAGNPRDALLASAAGGGGSFFASAYTPDQNGWNIGSPTDKDAVNKWHHLLFKIDGSANFALYYDGSIVTNGTRVSANFISAPGEVRSHIGAYQNVYQSPNLRSADSFIGGIDDVRIYSRCLSDGEVRALYEYESPLLVQPPVFVSHPVSKTVNLGDNVVLSVELQTAGTYNYQWQLNEQNIAGATAPRLSINNSSAGVNRYRVIVSNSSGTVVSDTATITVNTPPAPSIITQPVPKTVQEGANISLNVVATGQGSLVYQWQFNEQNIPGGTSSNLNLNGVKLNTAGRYRVLVSSQYGVTISDTVSLIVNANPPPTIVTQPISKTPAEGTQVSLTVTATGLGALTYQWQVNNQNIPGATSSTLVLSAVRPSANGKYRVIVGNPYGTTISTEATVTVVVTDADSDGLSDYEELLFGTNVNKADSDGDGLSDFAEVKTHGSNPLTTDTDGDGYSDGIEVARDGNPNNRSVTPTGALAVFPAVDVEFYTLNGVKYQLEVSTDMAVWTAQGSVVVGNGGSQNHLVRASKATQFWRLKVVQ
jgi:hypothetical protein